MQFEQDQVRLTASEAHWIVANMAGAGGLDLARKTERARRAAVAPHVPPGIFDGVVELLADAKIDAKNDQDRLAKEAQYLSILTTIADVEKQHSVDPNGNELHNVTLPITQSELDALYQEAATTNDLLRSDLMDFTASMAETDDLPQLQQFFEKSSDASLSDEAKVWIHESIFNTEFKELQVTAGIVAAIQEQHTAGGS